MDANDGSLGFSFSPGHAAQDIDATIEKLFELPAELSADRSRRAALVLDEFQEILDIDPNLPRLMRAIFQAQPDVAHVYLGSKRAMLERLFNQLLAEGQLNSANQSGEFMLEHPDYHWNVQTAQRDYGLTEVNLRVMWLERGQEHELVVSTLAYGTSGGSVQ